MIELILFIIGTVAGSYAVASVWRLRAEQIADDKQAEDYQKLIKRNRLNQVKAKDDYSRCLACGYRLRWFDMIPIISWLMLGGKCRHCQKPIGWTEFLTEIGAGLLFAFSYRFWPYALSATNLISLMMFGLFLALTVVLLILFVYDIKWLELPTGVLYLAVFLSIVFAILKISYSLSQPGYELGLILVDYLLASLILAGIYLFLNKVSKGVWVGSGDAYIGLALALLVGNWTLAFIALFSANLIGSLIVFPGMLSKKINRQSHLPLGPLLILGGFIAFFAGQYLIYRFLPVLSLYSI